MNMGNHQAVFRDGSESWGIKDEGFLADGDTFGKMVSA